jgi:membrane protease YdiL (CAAX protease family)
LNAPGKILLFFCATILFGCVLAPPLYWAGQALAAQGVLRFLGATDFQKFFNRAMLVAAVLLLWPTVRWLGVGGWRDFGLQPDVHWRQHLAIGFGVAAIAVGAMAAAYIAGGVYRWKSELPWSQLPKLALSATVVSILEETLFRGAIFGLFRKTLSARGALLWVTAIFAILHFLKPTATRWLAPSRGVPDSPCCRIPFISSPSQRRCSPASPRSLCSAGSSAMQRSAPAPSG